MIRDHVGSQQGMGVIGQGDVIVYMQTDRGFVISGPATNPQTHKRAHQLHSQVMGVSTQTHGHIWSTQPWWLRVELVGVFVAQERSSLRVEQWSWMTTLYHVYTS